MPIVTFCHNDAILCVLICGFSYRCCESASKLLHDFYEQMTNPKYSAVTDVYAFMFICDIITFLIVVFGYASFGPSVSCLALADVCTVQYWHLYTMPMCS